MIEFKSQSEEQTAAMKEFAEALNVAFEVLLKRPMSNSVQKVADKLQEALMWHTQAVLNEEEMGAAVIPSDPASPLEGEILQAS